MIAVAMIYLGMASFFPLYVHAKFNENGQNELISATMISLCISAFMTAQLFCVFIHAKTISLMGRKRALLIAFAVVAITNVCLGLAAWFPADRPKSFIAFVVFTRLV